MNTVEKLFLILCELDFRKYMRMSVRSNPLLGDPTSKYLTLVHVRFSSQEFFNSIHPVAAVRVIGS